MFFFEISKLATLAPPFYSPLIYPTLIRFAISRRVIKEIQANSSILGKVPSMTLKQLQPILKKHGLSDVGTLGELISRTTKLLEGKIKASAEAGELSKFGENAVRILFRMSDKVNKLQRFGLLRSKNI